jgi:hypothetical protein
MNEATAWRYSRLRWLGIFLFWIAGAVLGVSLWAVIQGWMEPGRLVFCMLGLGLSLGSFGTASDTALHAYRELHRAGALPPAFAEEWQTERRKRADHIPGLHANPKIALVMPLLALAAMSWSIWRLVGVWGGG